VAGIPPKERLVPAAAARPRDLAWPSCFNARDLGGHATADGRRTRWRAAVRADNMAHLTAAGRDALLAYGVRTVVDLLSESEHAYEPPHPFRAGAASGAVPGYVHAPLIDEADAETTHLGDRAPSREASYRLMLERCGRRIARAVRAVADAPDGGVVFHCHAGLDRTGLVAALVLGAVGVPAETVVEDYARSEERLGAFYEHYRSLITDPLARARFKRLTAPPELTSAALAHLDARHGGAEAYLRSVGLNADELSRLRARLLDG
jgi:protein tyrosine/serine phosphatase